MSTYSDSREVYDFYTEINNSGCSANYFKKNFDLNLFSAALNYSPECSESYLNLIELDEYEIVQILYGFLIFYKDDYEDVLHRFWNKVQTLDDDKIEYIQVELCFYLDYEELLFIGKSMSAITGLYGCH